MNRQQKKSDLMYTFYAYLRVAHNVTKKKQARKVTTAGNAPVSLPSFLK